MRDRLLYGLGLGLVKFIQVLPLGLVARLGRAGGALAWHLDARHRRVALANLTAVFEAEKSPAEIQAMAREHFKRLGENYGCAIKTAAMSAPALARRLEFAHVERLQTGPDQGCVFAIGHFGNFELYARATLALPGRQFATTYRALKQPGLDRLLRELRARSGCLLFERRLEGEALKSALRRQPLVLGLLSDQHAGRHGAWIPFFGRPCSTTPAPALLALRYKLPLHTAICYRIGLARWRIEFGERIPTETAGGGHRSVEAILQDVNQALETAVRRDPPNWFWVHHRWKEIRLRTAPPRPDTPVAEPAPAQPATESRPE